MFILPFFISLSLTPICIKLSAICGAMDYPDGIRKLHTKPTAKLGGIPIYISFLLTSLSYLLTSGLSLAVMLGGAVALLGGVIDDTIDILWHQKLLLQCCAGIVGVSILLTEADALSFVGSVALSVALINGFNLLDGVDGLSASVAILSTSFIAVILGGESPTILVFAILGFLPYNFPAKIFLGESGASFIGYAVSMLLIANLKGGGNASLLFAVALPLAEPFFTFLRRIVLFKNPFRADRCHFHHKLKDRGFSDASVVLIMLTLTILFGFLAVI